MSSATVDPRTSSTTRALLPPARTAGFFARFAAGAARFGLATAEA
jgi:hypothetical protein